MCIECKNSALKHFPLATTEQHVNLLWCGTCFPFGHGEQVESMLADLERKSNGEYDLAMEITHREFDEAWERDRPLREQWEREEREAEQALINDKK
jgi:hypothetical protein